MKGTAIGNWVVVELPEEKEETTKFGIIVPIEKVENTKPLKVVSVGSDCKIVKVGQEAICKTFAMEKFEYDGKKLAATRESEVFAVKDENGVSVL